MTVILFIITTIIIVYLLYPVFLMASPEYKHHTDDQNSSEQPVSLILLTYNGIAYIEDKIKLLSQALEYFLESEFLIVDDNSSDGTQVLLESLKDRYKFKLILKNEHRGIPHSMNLGANIAMYDNVVFSDQRQKFNPDSIRELIKPLLNDEVGAVSAYISCLDHAKQLSLLRKHENFIKECESRTGYLIGVYGPLYAVRKSCYREIGENMVLDDLYLSLKILSGKRIVLMKKCILVDDDFNSHYNFNRSKRYLHGLLQILFRRKLIGQLPARVKIMLLWHKYLRLLIPPLAILCYLWAAWLLPVNAFDAVIFSGISFIILISILARKINIFSNLNIFFRINAYYFVSMIYIAIQRMFQKAVIIYRTKKI
jgi:cellulose synthase/poly-beta-1,6-N-acetylglucosamine synthase-like glycosyltransferase